MGLRFSADGPDFPTPLIDALLDGRVLFLCGAGISTPQLPGFGGLVTRVYEELGVTFTDGEKEARDAYRYEEVLGSLARRLADQSAMHNTVRKLLMVENPHLDKHRTILRLSRNLDNRVAIVTTNFDTFFERAIEEMAGKGEARKNSFAGQSLPLPGADDFGGIIHIHGRLDDPKINVESTPLVLTSAEYGEAYMRSGWAARFLFDLVRCKMLVLVGYSAGDAPIRYFLNVLEADRARFSDLQPVYALDAVDGDYSSDGDRWTPIAVRSLGYRRGRKGDADRHAALWRDLTALAELVEQPKVWRRRRAAELLTVPFDAVCELELDIVAWLLVDKRDLWDVVIKSVTDSRWFDYFAAQKLWIDEDAAWVLGAWCGLGWAEQARLEAAIPWRRRYGDAFGEALRNRMLSDVPKDKLYRKAWNILADQSVFEHNDLLAYRIAARINSEDCTDADLNAGVELLTPRASLSDVMARLMGRARVNENPKRLSDIAFISLGVPDSSGAAEIISALKSMEGKAERILEIASEALRATVALAHEIEFIGPEWDRLDSAVPTVEGHPQNEHHDGLTHLVELISHLYSVVARSDSTKACSWAKGWSQLPSLIGTRLYLNAMRDKRAFTADEVASAVIALDHNAFWSIRRELILAMAERLGGARGELIDKIVARVISEAPSLYENLDGDAAGKTDWRPQVRDRDAWLRLEAIKSAGCLPQEGIEALTAIAERHPFIGGDFTEQDLFGSWSSGVRTVVGDPEPLRAAAPEERLPIAQKFAAAWNPDTQRNWSAYCGADPGGALEALKIGGLQNPDARLWMELIGALTWARQGEEGDPSGARVAMVREVFTYLLPAGDPFVLQLLPRLADILPLVRTIGEVDADAWWDRLWSMAELVHDPIQTEGPSRFFDQVINTPAGRLAEHLVSTIDTQKSKSRKITRENRERIRRVMNSATNAGWLGRAALVREAGFVHFLDPIGSVRYLRPWVAREDEQGVSLRAVLVGRAQLGTKATRAYRYELLLAVAESQATGETAASVALSLLRPLFIGALNGDRDLWGLTQGQVRDVLKVAAPSILDGASRAFQIWTNPNDVAPEKAWRKAIRPVFEAVWPRESRFLRPSSARNLAAACVDAGKAFPEAFETVRHYLTPFHEGWTSLYFLTKSKAPEAYPDQVLRLLWILCGPGSGAQSVDLGKVLDRLAQAKASLVNDRRYQWLEQRAVRYD
jgi:hypothetical protein